MSNWDKIEIIKMPDRHDDITTFRAFMYDGEKVVNIVEHGWENPTRTLSQGLRHLLWMVLNIK